VKREGIICISKLGAHNLGPTGTLLESVSFMLTLDPNRVVFCISSLFVFVFKSLIIRNCFEIKNLKSTSCILKLKY